MNPPLPPDFLLMNPPLPPDFLLMNPPPPEDAGTRTRQGPGPRERGAEWSGEEEEKEEESLGEVRREERKRKANGVMTLETRREHQGGGDRGDKGGGDFRGTSPVPPSCRSSSRQDNNDLPSSLLSGGCERIFNSSIMTLASTPAQDL
ncbi:unnamed protein product [Arctogadus glacialis]